MRTKSITKCYWLLRTGMLAGVLGASCWAGTAYSREVCKEEMHQTFPLAADGRLSLGNVNGSVRLSVWDRPEVKLDAIKSARSKKDLERLKIEIESKPGYLAVRTRHPESRRWWGWRGSIWGSVDYTLTVPRSARLEDISNVNGLIEIEGARGHIKASTVNGPLRANGLAGSADLSSVNGAVKAAFVSLAQVKSVSASTVNGAVELDMPAGADADISASTVNGGISGDLSVKKNWPIGAEVNTRLGQGGAKISLSTVNGPVRIHLEKLETEKPR
ncbi:MAG: DUF4097 family beta strand repeat-containing protein [Limisphaerales bacterium]